MTQFTPRTRSPYRFDVVGSFLRPQEITQARAQFAAGDLDAEGLRAVEDAAIIDIIKKQEAAGLKGITDGEFRRSWWHYDFFWGLNGVEKTFLDQAVRFHGETIRPETARIVDSISGTQHPFVKDFEFVRDHVAEGSEPRQTCPAPAQFIQECLRDFNLAATRQFYPDNDALVEAVASAYHDFFRELYDAGCRTVQLDDCTWGRLIGNNDQLSNDDGVDLKSLYLEANNRAIAGKPDGLHVTMHVCRGNYRSHWFSQGAYDSVATPLFDQQNVEAYYLEYDSDRSGGFGPLAKVSGDKYVVLGLITSKTGELEDRQSVIDRIHEAAQYIDIDRLCLSPQCGFASTEEGNALTEEQQWAKIDLVRSIAEEVWG